MTTLNSRLQLALLNRKKARNLLEKGFTLVELMIVMVIVAVLSSIALPQFLNQRLKAIATEATTQVGAISSAAHAESLETALDALAIDGTTGSCDSIQGTINSDRFTYACELDNTAGTFTVTATGIAESDAATIQVTQVTDLAKDSTDTIINGVLSNVRGDFDRNLEFDASADS